MLVFVDESGDPGTRGKPESSPYFVVTAIIIDDHDEATRLDAAVDHLRNTLGFPKALEFKFNKSNRLVREAFLTAIATFDFYYSSLVLNKAKLTGPGFAFKDSLYKYTSSLLFKNISPWLSSAKVAIDGSGSRRFRRQLSSYLCKRINDQSTPPRIKKVTIEASKKNNLIQVADMVCGAIARYYKPDKGDRRVYRALIRHRELSVQKWPR